MAGRKLLRAALIAVVLIAAVTTPAPGASLASTFLGTCGNGRPSTVVGTNNPALDVRAVQAAVANSDSVLLEGTFDFGNDGRVELMRDVQICGEADEAGLPLTTIRRGEWDFFTPYPTFATPLPLGPRVSIQQTHFAESRGTAIHLAYSGGASIRGNVIDAMRARKVGAVAERAAIVVGPAVLG